MARGKLDPPLRAWASTAVGVVTLADTMPVDGDKSGDIEYWYENVVREVAVRLAVAPAQAEELKPVFAAGRGHIIGTSGAVTSLAALHLGLKKYRRADVDGLWIGVNSCRKVAAQLRRMSHAERAAHPCIGKDRADLVLPGAAILEAVCRLWPAARIRVADRGLREGVLMQLIAAHRKRGLK
jgi:exopolyphosphatase/guanosine-5'-triphosphate,3'-diphosphate pyrophosphatase